MLSKLPIAISFGIENPLSFKHFSTPIAIKSVTAMIAVGLDFINNFSLASKAPPTVQSEFSIRFSVTLIPYSLRADT